MRVITVARKPLSEGNVASNVLKHGTGALNIDASRIGVSKRVPYKQAGVSSSKGFKDLDCGWGLKPAANVPGMNPDVGRWPANLILEHKAGCTCEGTRRVSVIGAAAHQPHHKKGNILAMPVGVGHPGFREADGKETVDSWACVPECPVGSLGDQSGVLHARGNTSPTKRNKSEGVWGAHGATMGLGVEGVTDPGDKGTAARFFKQVQACE